MSSSLPAVSFVKKWGHWTVNRYQISLVNYYVPTSHLMRNHHPWATAGRGVLAPHPWNLKKNDVICCCPTKYPKIVARALGARHKYPIFQSKTSKQTHKNFVCACGAPKNGRFFVRRSENVSIFLNVGGVAPPLWKKNLRAPMPTSALHCSN